MSDTTNEIGTDDGSGIATWALSTAIISQLIEQKVFTLDQATNVFRRATSVLTSAAMAPDRSIESRESMELAIALLMGYSADLSDLSASAGATPGLD